MTVKPRSLSGSVAVGVFAVAFVCVCVAFATPAWVVSDYRISGAKLNRFGLWVHCFRSLPDPQQPDAPVRFFAGCRWIYDPFTAGYSEIRGFLLPGFMVATQFFFTLCFLACLGAAGAVLLFVLCSYPEQTHYIKLIVLIAGTVIGAGVCGVIAVIIFACFGNTDGWMPGHANNYLGYSFGLGVAGACLCLIAGALFFVEVYVQSKKRRYITESQTHFQLQS